MIGIFDGLMLAMLLFTAWRAIASPTLFGCAVAFISFGLLMALAWLRLEAPDVALAEAAVGAGVTGSLLLSSLGRLRNATSNEGGEER
jgi:uncharacterized MnhB-related membrane protein